MSRCEAGSGQCLSLDATSTLGPQLRAQGGRDAGLSQRAAGQRQTRAGM